MTTTRTLRNVAAGAVVGTVASFVPLVMLVAPLLGGVVAGSLERAGAKRGALVGAVTGVVVAFATALVTAVSLFVNLGALPLENLGGVPVAGVVLAGALWTVATAGQAIVAAIGGALGGIVEADRKRIAGSASDRSRLLNAVGSAVAGLFAFVAVALGLTAALDPYVWPSLLVGLPIGGVAGVAVAVLGYHYLTGRAASRRGGSPGVN